MNSTRYLVRLSVLVFLTQGCTYSKSGATEVSNGNKSGGDHSSPSPAGSGGVIKQYASYVLGVSTEYNESPRSWSAQQMLGAPNVESYGDEGAAWAPESSNMAIESVTLGFNTPVQATSIMIRETDSYGFIKKITLIDVDNASHAIWTSTAQDFDNPAHLDDINEFTRSWTATEYLVKAVKIDIDTNATEEYEEIDSILLEGYAPAFSSEYVDNFISSSSAPYGAIGDDSSAMQAYGAPNVNIHTHSASAFVFENEDADTQTVMLGVVEPLYSTGVSIFESYNPGFVTKIELRDVDGNMHTVWQASGGDTDTPADSTALWTFTRSWPKTSYKVNAVQISVNTALATDKFEEIDAVKLIGTLN